MILYHAISTYQLMLCICLKLNEARSEKGVCILPDFIVKKFPQYKMLERYGIFHKVVLFPYAGPRPSSMETIRQIGDKVYKKVLPYSLEEFDQIYCASTQFWFAAYLVEKKISFHYIEDGSEVFYRRLETYKEEMKRMNSSTFYLADGLGLLDGSCPLIDKIYADCPEGYAWENPRMIRCNLVTELRRLSQADIYMIKKFFGVEEIEIPHPSNSLLFLTGMWANVNFLTLKDQEYMEAITVDYFSRRPELVIKPHPDDILNKQHLFPDATVLPRAFPIELLLDYMESRNAHVMSVSSSAMNNFSTDDKILFTMEYGSGGFRVVHRYYAVKKLFEHVSALSPFTFVMQGGEACIFRNFGVEVSTDLDGTSVPFVFVGSRDVPWDKIKNALQKPNAVLVLDEMHGNLWDLLQDWDGCLWKRCLDIRGDSGEPRREESIYILATGNSWPEEIRNFHYEKHLKYAKETVRVEPLSEQDLEIAMLKGILEATECRLKLALQENEELREKLMEQEEK